MVQLQLSSNSLKLPASRKQLFVSGIRSFPESLFLSTQGKIVPGRSTNRLASIIDEDINSAFRIGELEKSTKSFNPSDISQIETINLYAVLELIKISFFLIGFCGGIRKPRRGHHGGPRPQEFQTGLETNLDTRSSHHSYLAIQVRSLMPFVPV